MSHKDKVRIDNGLMDARLDQNCLVFSLLYMLA